MQTPNQPPLASENVVVSAPMSFTGSAQRAWRINSNATGWARVLVVAFVIVPLVIGWWCFIGMWYVTFGVLLVPYRILRRGARKRKRDALRHREVLDAVKREQA